MLPLNDDQPSGITPLVTYLIIGVCTVILVFEFFSTDITGFLSKWALVPGYIEFSQPETLYTFITSIFLHGGLMHFLSNMWFLRIFGDNVEGALGHVKFLLFFIIGGIVAGITQYVFLIGQIIPILGASGAIAAVLGFYAVRFPRHKIHTLIPSIFFFFNARLSSRIVLAFWFITQVFNGAASLTGTSANSGVAWWAHIGGFVFGYAVAKVTEPKVRKQTEIYTQAIYPDEVL